MQNQKDKNGRRTVIKNVFQNEVFKVSGKLEMVFEKRRQVLELIDTVKTMRKQERQIQTIKFVTVMRENVLRIKNYEPFDLIRK